MVDAETVKTDAKNVKPKRDETNVRRWWLEKRRLLAMGILYWFMVHIKRCDE